MIVLLHFSLGDKARSCPWEKKKRVCSQGHNNYIPSTELGVLKTEDTIVRQVSGTCMIRGKVGALPLHSRFARKVYILLSENVPP